MEKLVKRENLTSNEIIEMLASPDTLTKKMTCSYLTERYLTDSNLGLLTANIFLKDCSDPNPNVRSISILALATVPDMEDAAINIVYKGFTDPSAQVRRSCAEACMKLYELNADSFMKSDLIDCLYDGIRDTDPIVISNCLISLESILNDEGGIVINKNIAHHLLSQLACFSSCSLVYVINILRKYKPKCEEEIFQILNAIDFCFTSSVSSVLISAMELFFYLTKDYKNLINDMLETIKNPVCKIMNQNCPEVCYLMLNFLKDLNICLEDIFGCDYKYFLIRAKDLGFLKCQKLKFIPLIVNKTNVNDIINEIKYHTSDFQSFRAAFQSLSVLGSFNEDSKVQVLIILTKMLKGLNEQITASALECLLCILSDGASLKTDNGVICTESLLKTVSTSLINPALHKDHPRLLLNAVMVFAPVLPDVRDCLEQFYYNFDHYTSEEQCHIITVVALSFLSWPSSIQHLLSGVLVKGSISEMMEVVQHTMFIYSILENDPNEACQLLSVGFLKPES